MLTRTGTSRGRIMSDGTLISWSDATWNVITGCSIVSRGCRRCYAMKLAGGRLRNHPSRAGLTQPSAAGPVWTGEVRFNEQWLRQPLQLRRGREIFVCAHSDLFHPSVPDAWRDRIFAVMLLASQHTYQCLTKRPEIAARYLGELATPAGYDRIGAQAELLGGNFYLPFEHERDSFLLVPPSNIWIGASVEDQPCAEERRRHLAVIAAHYWQTWVSYEPALGPVSWRGWEFLRYAVSGGESGNGALPSHPQWHRDLRDFCARVGAKYHMKQWGVWASTGPAVGTRCAIDQDGRVADMNEPGSFGSFPPGATSADGWQTMYLVGKLAAGATLDGVDHVARMSDSAE